MWCFPLLIGTLSFTEFHFTHPQFPVDSTDFRFNSFHVQVRAIAALSIENVSSYAGVEDGGCVVLGIWSGMALESL